MKYNDNKRILLKGIVFIIIFFHSGSGTELAKCSYFEWANGPSCDLNFFPIGVWLQDPKNALKYKAAGFNIYIGLWEGPTEYQFLKLKEAGMNVICDQNNIGLRHINDPIIIGWMSMDEPDNAQSILGLPARLGLPIPPEDVIKKYFNIKSKDKTRPVFLNLGQGVAWDSWYGRGFRTNHSEDYIEYIKGADIISFDIYPVIHPDKRVAGKLWYIAKGIKRLKNWSKGQKKIIWNCVECTRINNPGVKPTPDQVRSEVWMSIIHGSMGIIYFVHEWEPEFNEAALLDETEMLNQVVKINEQITGLASILNSETMNNLVNVSTINKEKSVDFMVKKSNKTIYLFAIEMCNGNTTAEFIVEGLSKDTNAIVLGESRKIRIKNGSFRDIFKPWEVHLYRID